MEIQRLLTSFSSSIINQFAVVMGAMMVLILFNFDTLYSFYFENQLIGVGIAINAGILGLLCTGLGNILFHLLRYRREEAAIGRVVNNIKAFNPDRMEGLPEDSMVAGRHAMMRSIQRAHGDIDQSALAAMQNADESARFGLIRFINNILILTGVFGTIVSLSLALLGISDLMEPIGEGLGGMELVIHAMSTALSTTITAIVAYLVFGYFFIRVVDVQAYILSSLEHLTSIYLLPQCIGSEEDVLQKIDSLIKSLVYASEHLRMTQEIYRDASMNLQQAIVTNRRQFEDLGDEMDRIKRILPEGFRLPPGERIP